MCHVFWMLWHLSRYTVERTFQWSSIGSKIFFFYVGLQKHFYVGLHSLWKYFIFNLNILDGQRTKRRIRIQIMTTRFPDISLCIDGHKLMNLMILLITSNVLNVVVVVVFQSLSLSHFIIVAPIEVVVVAIILWYKIDWSGIAGMSLIVLLLPVLIILSRIFARMRWDGKPHTCSVHVRMNEWKNEY